MIIPGIKKHLANYDIENILFQNIGPKAKKRGYLNFNEFYYICMWKSPRPKKKYLTNKATIEEITKKVFKEKDEEKRINLLCSLGGVGIPTASAILSVVLPEEYPIIDIRCIQMLESLKLGKYNTYSVSSWIKYLDTMRSLAKENNVSPRELDKVLFAMHREQLDKEEFRNLYN